VIGLRRVPVSNPFGAFPFILKIKALYEGMYFVLCFPDLNPFPRLPKSNEPNFGRKGIIGNFVIGKGVIGAKVVVGAKEGIANDFNCEVWNGT
jgi:hypothetical protein